jgi:hypothetical protein
MIMAKTPQPPAPLFSPEDVRVLFAGAIVSGLMSKHGDLGGKDDNLVMGEVFRLADKMVVEHFESLQP